MKTNDDGGFFRRFRSLMCLVTMPRFHFDQKLFRQLISEQEAKAQEASQDEPKVEFCHGDMAESHLGLFARKDGSIKIDVLNVFLRCIEQEPESAHELHQMFDQELTSTLAHEGGHWRLDKRYGFWAYLDKTIIHISFMLAGLFLLMLLVGCMNSFVLTAILYWLKWSNVCGPAIALAIIGFWLLVIPKAVAYFFRLWFIVAAVVNYQVSFTERYARGFAKEAVQDKRWEGVIRIDD